MNRFPKKSTGGKFLLLLSGLPGLTLACFMSYCGRLLFSNLKLNVMLRWTIIFLVVAIIAAIFGFGGLAAGAAGIAKVLFVIFIILFLVSLISGRRRGVDL